MVSYKRDVIELDGELRAAQKQASREHDLVRLQAGEISRDALNAENSFFAPLKLVNARIAAIGGRPIEQVR
jgi:hypothetical protein